MSYGLVYLKEYHLIFLLLQGLCFLRFPAAMQDTYFESLEKINKGLDTPLYAMPILETEDFIYHEKRSELFKIYWRNI